MNLIGVQEILFRKGLRLFSSQELRRATGLSQNAVRLWLIRQVQRGTVKALKRRRGLYCLSGSVPHDWLIANRLYLPSYISLETALSHYGIFPEAVYPITSVTTKATRAFATLDREFVFQKIKRQAYGGYRTEIVEGQTVLIAEREKALADYLYLVHLGKKNLNERLRFRGLKERLFRNHLKRFQRRGLVEWGQDVVSRGS